jgi:hypothetical protein
MDLAGANLEVDAFQYVFARDAGAQVANFEQSSVSFMA